MHVFLAVVLVASTTASAPVVAGPQVTSRLNGFVRDATGAPLPNVRVTLTGAGSYFVQTGADGVFAFERLPEGEYELVAAVSGFAPVTRSVHLAPGQTLTVSLTLSVAILEQTVVTADKTGERQVQDTPMAVTVISATELDRVQARTIEDMARAAPSVTFSQNTGFAQLTIRGIGTNAVFTGTDPSSAVYVDGVYMARPAMVVADFLDLERVEVLRGPQGILYGRNAVGGAVNIITTDPTNDFQYAGRFAAGTSGTFRGDARFSGPILAGRVMASVALLRGVARGFVQDVDHHDRPLGGEDVTAGRAKLRVVLNRRSELLFSGDLTQQTGVPLTYAKVLAVKPGFQVNNPADLHEVRTSTVSTSRNLQYGTALRFTAQLTPQTSLTSLTAFRKLDYDVFVDTDITELDVAASDTHEIQHQWSEELTIVRQHSRLSWIGGVFLFDDRDRQASRIRLGAARVENQLDPIVESDSAAIFGQTTIGLPARLSAVAGLRYTRERKTIRNSGRVYTLDAPVSLVSGTAYEYADAISHNALTPRVALEWRANERTLTYLSATRGFKSGGFNISSPESGRGFAPEWAWSYEGGLKMAGANGRTRLNVAAFVTDYSNLQVQIAIRPGVLDISNAAAATIRGVEIETASQLFRPLRVGGYVTWLDARYDRYQAVGVGGVMGDAAGHRLNNSPEWSGRSWLEWDQRIGRAGTLSLRPEVLWQSTVFFTPFNDPIQRQSRYALVNVSAGLRPDRGCCTVTAYARNLTSEDYITGTFSSPPPAIGGRPGPPRRAGVELTIRR